MLLQFLRIGVLALFLSAMALCSVARAQGDPGPALSSMADFKAGKFQFTSIKNQVWWFRVNEGPHTLAGADRIYVPAVLFMPNGATGRVPAMVIMHGIGGAYTKDGSKRVYWEYAEELAKAGVAAVVVDTHGGRGVGVAQMLAAPVVPVFAFVADAFAVLDLLKTHPGIDPDRVGVMGFSKGGATALLASDERAARALSPASSMFALHVAIYPGCHGFPEKPRLRRPEVLFIVGDRDNYTGISSCVEIQEKMARAGTNARFVKLENATHGWDEAVQRLHIDDVSSEDCRWRMQEDGRELSHDGREVIGRPVHGGQVGAAEYWRTCTKKLSDIYIEHNARAKRESMRLTIEAAKNMKPLQR